jgi:hypothetical protein
MTQLEIRNLERLAAEIRRRAAEKRFIQLTYRGTAYQKAV